MGILIGGALLFRLLFLGCRRALSQDAGDCAESRAPPRPESVP